MGVQKVVVTRVDLPYGVTVGIHGIRGGGGQGLRMVGRRTTKAEGNTVATK